jgi:hypothetical protein
MKSIARPSKVPAMTSSARWRCRSHPRSEMPTSFLSSLARYRHGADNHDLAVIEKDPLNVSRQELPFCLEVCALLKPCPRGRAEGTRSALAEVVETRDEHSVAMPFIAEDAQLLSIDISWTSTLPAISAEPPISRSGAVPLYRFFRRRSAIGDKAEVTRTSPN